MVALYLADVVQKAEQDLPLLKKTRAYRLKNQTHFQSVFAQSCKVTCHYTLGLYRPNQQPHSRLGIIVSKSRIKKATDRNQAKRIIRESFRHHKNLLKGLDIIVIIRTEWARLDGKKKLRDDITHLWKTLIASLNPS